MSKTRVTIQGRLAFPVLSEPEQFQGQGKPRYSATIIFEPGSDSDKKVLSAMRAAAANKWGEDKADKAVTALTKAMRTAYIDGDTKAEYEGFEGHMAVSAHAQENQPPALVVTKNGENVRLDRKTQGVIYAGCYVNAIVDFWAQDNQWGKRINAQICGLQFVRDGDSFGGGGPAVSEDDFEAIDIDKDVDTGDLEPDFDDDFTV